MDVKIINNLSNKAFRTGFSASDGDIADFKIKYSTEHKLFALYSLYRGYYCLDDVFHDYSGAKHEVKKMIDRTPGMKEKINNFFN